MEIIILLDSITVSTDCDLAIKIPRYALNDEAIQVPRYMPGNIWTTGPINESVVSPTRNLRG